MAFHAVALHDVAADLKTRQGLKLFGLQQAFAQLGRCSGLENPTGIETYQPASDTLTIYSVAADLKTRQGLKLGNKLRLL